MSKIPALLPATLVLATQLAGADTTELCLDGELDLGARYQGMTPAAGEWYAARWCVTTDDDSDRLRLSMRGNTNPDMIGSWAVAFIPPDLVRIVGDDGAPDIEFHTSQAALEADRIRFLDPRRQRAVDASPDLRTRADLPLRGSIQVQWHWRSGPHEAPRLEIAIGNDDTFDTVVFRGTASRRTLSAAEAADLWRAKPEPQPVEVAGDRWPSRVAMELISLTDGVFVVRNVRTGFHHMVVETAAGLVVADAPAGWVELHQFPPTDLVPGLGVSGLSERFIDFLAEQFPDTPIRAVALTHHHDDHAGGARAFAAAGAAVYAPTLSAGFLEEALNRDTMPRDRLSASGTGLTVLPVDEQLVLDDAEYPVSLINLGASPHVNASIGVLANGYFFQSDLHVPRSDADEPRADRAATECWFAAWAVDNLPSATRVINTHTDVATPVSRLARYLESERCSGAALES